MSKGKKASVRERFMLDVMRTGSILESRLNRVLGEQGLTAVQFNILRILRGAEEVLSIGEIKSRMLFETSDVSRLIDRLVKKELVNREICETNRRKMEVSLSQQGLDVVVLMNQRISESLGKFYEDILDEEQAEEFMLILERLRAFDEES